MTKPVLIVEDDDTIRENLKDILEMEGYTVLEAGHGKVALELLRSRLASDDVLPFLILLDLNMPVMPGREFLAAFRAEAPTLSRIPIVVMTAVPDAASLGTAGFLRKPIDLEHLLTTIHQFLKASSTRFQSQPE